MVHLIIINRFNWSVTWVWNTLIGINSMMTKYPHDSWNKMNSIGIRGEWSEVSCWRLAVTLYWWSSQFINMECSELIHIYPKTRKDKFMTTNDTRVSLVSNYYIEFTDNILSKTENCNEWMDRWCIIVVGIWINKRAISPKLTSQVIWVSNNV